MISFTFHCVPNGSSEIQQIVIQAENINGAIEKFNALYPDHEVGVITFPPLRSEALTKMRPVVKWESWL